jgi:hypothetical protein
VALVALAGLTALLGGCTAMRRELPVMLYVAVSVQDETNLNSENAALFRERFNLLVQDFRRVRPNVLVQVTLYPEAQMPKQLALRTRAGLGPDLILTGADSAHTLLLKGVVDPLPDSPQLRENTAPELLQRMRSRNGLLSGQPLIVFPQLACYDKRRLKTSPTTLSGLLQVSATGVPVGLPMNLRQLLWTAGGFGAIPGLAEAAIGRQPSPLDRARIRSWLAWLQEASNQQRVTFVADQTQLRQSFREGGMAWVSCSSGELDLLRRKVGPHLGVASLPNGAAHPASPVNRLRVLALGRNSSPAQRAMSLELINFSVGPLVQRSFTLDSLSFLPVNPFVSIPVQSSNVLQAMVESRQQARNVENLLAGIHQEDPRIPKLETTVIVPLLFGLIEPDAAADRTISILRNQP